MFKVGKKVVCIDKFLGVYIFTKKKCGLKCPDVNEIYTVVEILKEKDIEAIKLKELRGVFMSCKFRPLDYSFGEEVLTEIEIEINQKEKIEII
jgi:hypothetical protein